MFVRGKLGIGFLGLIVCDLLLGIPLGAVIGFVVGSVIGHFAFDRPKQQAAYDDFKAYKHRQGEFLYYTVALCAKIAKIDQPVNRQEINHMENIMRQTFRLNEQGRRQSIKVWQETKDSQQTFDNMARAFYRDFGRERHQVLNMMDLLFSMVAADGGLHPSEEDALLRAAGVFHISRLQYDRMKSRYYATSSSRQQQQQQRWSPLDPYYAILGAEPHENLETIKQKFRRLVMQWHPDKVAARGASSEAQRHAKEKFQQINDAYERIVASRK